MSLLDELPHTVNISRVLWDADEFAGDVPSDSLYAANEPAWVQPASATQITEGQAKGMNVTHSVYLNRDPGLRFNDSMIPNNGDYAGKVLAVKSFREDSVGMGILWLVLVEIYRFVPIPDDPTEDADPAEESV